MVKKKSHFFSCNTWVWKMAWRDAQHDFSRLFLFVASLITGITATVAINSLNYGLRKDLDQNAKSLLGADLMVSSTQPFNPQVLATFDSMKLEHVAGAELFSMAMFMNKRESRLVRVVALNEHYPFYGKIETNPINTYQKVQKGNYAVLDDALMSQYAIGLQDSIKIGESYFRVAGRVIKAPEAVGGMSMYAPSIYIALHNLKATKLIQHGSRVLYKRFFKIENSNRIGPTIEQLEPILIKHGYQYSTVEQRKKRIGKSIESIYHFFTLLAFVSLILGCVGVANSVYVYAREKRNEAAILRCLGASGWQAFTIFFIQVFALGILGSIIGVGLGIGMQQAVVLIFKNYTNNQLQLGIMWSAAMEGLLLGLIVSALFVALPLISIRFVSPLSVLRVNNQPLKRYSKTKLLIVLLVALFPILGAWYQTKNIFYGLYFSIGLAVVCACLALATYCLLALARKYASSSAGFLFRHALSNLFRPNNQTIVLVMSIGLGVLIMSTLHIVQHSLLSQTEFTGNKNQPNVILFDIQTTQKKDVLNLIEKHNLSVNQMVPIVTCRLRTLNDRTIEQIRENDINEIPDWALTREYRVTYRDTLHTSEQMRKGEKQKLKKDKKDSIWVSISESMMHTLGLSIGDSLTFDVQGVVFPVKISGIRKVDWPKDPPNFIFVFPANVLEMAPQVWVMTTNINDEKIINSLQQSLVIKFPNISFIDLRIVFNIINDLLNEIGLAVRLLALFSIVTSMIVLASAVMNSRYIRLKENTLMRIIGARTHQISKIVLIEYAYLGFFSALTGIVLSFAIGWLLVHFLFEIDFSFQLYKLGLIGVTTMFITLLVGWLNSKNYR